MNGMYLAVSVVLAIMAPATMAQEIGCFVQGE